MSRPAIILPATLPPAQREAHRHIRLAGTHNLRDLGGYSAAGGRTVRWGVLYRSDQLSKLTRRGLAQVGALQLAVLVDLRSDEEREHAPDRLPDAAPFRVVEIPTLDVMREFGTELTHRLSRGDVAGVDVPALMTRTYRQFAAAFAPQFGQLVREVLAAGGRPLLIHCTAGKDRTGFAAALMLRLLDVPQETVLRDYALSTCYVLEAWRREILLLRLTRGRAAAAVVRQLCSAEEAYLQAAFRAVDQPYGSFDAYVREGLGLGAGDVARLRDTLLSEAPAL